MLNTHLDSKGREREIDRNERWKRTRGRIDSGGGRRITGGDQEAGHRTVDRMKKECPRDATEQIPFVARHTRFLDRSSSDNREYEWPSLVDRPSHQETVSRLPITEM